MIAYVMEAFEPAPAAALLRLIGSATQPVIYDVTCRDIVSKGGPKTYSTLTQ